ncbi:MAG: hypothetical protein AB7E80_13990, partial [Hyphomicrobiaceae bacterium]
MRKSFSLAVIAAAAVLLVACAHSRYAPYDDYDEATYERAFKERAAARQREAARRWAKVSRTSTG